MQILLLDALFFLDRSPRLLAIMFLYKAVEIENKIILNVLFTSGIVEY